MARLSYNCSTHLTPTAELHAAVMYTTISKVEFHMAKLMWFQNRFYISIFFKSMAKTLEYGSKLDIFCDWISDAVIKVSHDHKIILHKLRTCEFSCQFN